MASVTSLQEVAHDNRRQIGIGIEALSQESMTIAQLASLAISESYPRQEGREIRSEFHHLLLDARGARQWDRHAGFISPVSFETEIILVERDAAERFAILSDQ